MHARVFSNVLYMSMSYAWQKFRGRHKPLQQVYANVSAILVNNFYMLQQVQNVSIILMNNFISTNICVIPISTQER